MLLYLSLSIYLYLSLYMYMRTPRSTPTATDASISRRFAPAGMRAALGCHERVSRKAALWSARLG